MMIGNEDNVDSEDALARLARKKVWLVLPEHEVTIDPQLALSRSGAAGIPVLLAEGAGHFLRFDVLDRLQVYNDQRTV